ncbi:MAG TPA: tRNA pseudouridine(38-40) synthase TruA [Cytophagaceae bacterium]|nr:tRNA pseudouridine(38-40) synthase TruA [Cytophagaceae bacterium]
MRYFLDIAYKGTHYHGWQIQQNAHSVQQELENALQKILGQKIETLASGRTDTGVHAEQQIVHLDLEDEFTEQHVYKLNCVLPNDIAVKDFFPVTNQAHARFDATSRSYEYRITRMKNPFLIDNAYFYDRLLDLAKMNEAAVMLLNYHDFESFSKVHTDVKNFRCDIYLARWKEKNDLLIFEIEANRFLRGMVRAIVGSLIMVGLGKISVQDFEKMIISRSRSQAGPAAPPEGLFLTRIKYPDSVYLEE